MARFISSAATFEKESLSKEKETDISTVVIYLPREIYIYLCVHLPVWGCKTICVFPGPISVIKENSFIFNRGQIGRYEITMLYGSTRIYDFICEHLAIFCNVMAISANVW